jgi:hypothetical protein
VSPLKIKIPSKNMREKSTNATIIHSVPAAIIFPSRFLYWLALVGFTMAP